MEFELNFQRLFGELPYPQSKFYTLSLQYHYLCFSTTLLHHFKGLFSVRPNPLPLLAFFMAVSISQSFFNST